MKTNHLLRFRRIPDPLCPAGVPPTSLASSGYTLLELLVVVAIIASLSGVSIAVIAGMTRKANATKCLSGMQQFGVAVRAYVSDHENYLPDTGHVRAEDGTSMSWTNTLSTYLGAKFIGRCPTNTKSPAAITYAWNDLLTDTAGAGIPVAKCQSPASTLVVGETADSYTSEHFHFAGSRSKVTYNQFKAAVGVDRHAKGANYLFVDGHAEFVSLNDIKDRLAVTNTPLLNPNP